MSLVTQHRAALTVVRTRTSQIVGAAWTRLGRYDRDNVEPFVSQAVPVVLAGQRKAAAITNVYLSRRLGIPPQGVDLSAVTGGSVRAGADLSDVYARPFVTVWTALKNGEMWQTAVDAGFARLTAMAETDIMLAFRATASEIMQGDDRIVGYERVTGGNACDLCELASTQRYHSGDLMPIHDRCECDVEPIFGSEDPGQVVNQDKLDEINARGVEVAVAEHGELGPVLVNAADHFTDESELS